ncbi:hypothetical protein WJX84_008867 [Apatococcus fuscideae]|uniref:Uncharacterized protein n=1 Tax=Apatococcus fuscideae TaxID=2026836 RepID=A0AAW1SY26_9CHLO
MTEDASRSAASRLLREDMYTTSYQLLEQSVFDLCKAGASFSCPQKSSVRPASLRPFVVGGPHAGRCGVQVWKGSALMPQRSDRKLSHGAGDHWMHADFSPADVAPMPRREVNLGVGSQLLAAGIKKPRSRHCRRKRSLKGLSELVQKLRAVLGLPQDVLCPTEETASPPSQGLHLLESMLEQGPASSDELDAIQLLLNISCMASLPEPMPFGKAGQPGRMTCSGLATPLRPKLTDSLPWQKNGWSADQSMGRKGGQRHRSGYRKTPPGRQTWAPHTSGPVMENGDTERELSNGSSGGQQPLLPMPVGLAGMSFQRPLGLGARPHLPMLPGQMPGMPGPLLASLMSMQAAGGTLPTSRPGNGLQLPYPMPGGAQGQAGSSQMPLGGPSGSLLNMMPGPSGPPDLTSDVSQATWSIAKISRKRVTVHSANNVTTGSFLIHTHSLQRAE